MGKRIAFGPLVTVDKYVEEGSGVNNVMAIMSTMITTGIIPADPEMFLDEEKLFESPHNLDMPFNHHLYADVEEADQSLFLTGYYEDEGGVGEVVLDATAEGFDFDAYLDERERQYRSRLKRRRGKGLKKHLVKMITSADFSRIEYDPRRPLKVRGTTPLPSFAEFVAEERRSRRAQSVASAPA